MVADIRSHDLAHTPGVGESLDWASALHMLGVMSLDLDVARETLTALVKDADDQHTVIDHLDELAAATGT
ncbi:MAG: hypothetical protein HOQ27_15095 [Dermatophilaceae bacterium]|nr:hypothetical protein [Dermatophilaceae bacterium]